jgi:hypothetical protein
LIRTLLIKPVHPFDATHNRLQGNPDKTRRRETIAKKIKASAYATDEGLVGMLLHLQLCHPTGRSHAARGKPAAHCDGQTTGKGVPRTSRPRKVGPRMGELGPNPLAFLAGPRY